MKTAKSRCILMKYFIKHKPLISEECQIELLWKRMYLNFFPTSFFSARNISMAEEKLLLLVITYARPRLFFSTLRVHDPMVTNCYYTFFSTYNLVTTSVYFASTCSLRSNSRDSSLIFYSWKIGASFTYAQHEFVAFLWTQSFRLRTIC